MGSYVDLGETALEEGTLNVTNVTDTTGIDQRLTLTESDGTKTLYKRTTSGGVDDRSGNRTRGERHHDLRASLLVAVHRSRQFVRLMRPGLEGLRLAAQGCRLRGAATGYRGENMNVRLRKVLAAAVGGALLKRDGRDWSSGRDV